LFKKSARENLRKAINVQKHETHKRHSKQKTFGYSGIKLTSGQMLDTHTRRV